VLAEVLQVERVGVEQHFFDDLGADSMLMTRFCARVRKRDGLPSVAITDVYRHPTIRALAAAVAGPEPAPDQAAQSALPPLALPEPDEGRARATTAEYMLCGALQFMMFVAYVYLVSVVTTRGYRWIAEGAGVLDFYLRAVVFGGGLFAGLCVLPILAKWLLVGRWRPQRIRIWSLGYFRFWLVKSLIRANPLNFLINGSPLYALYLRALGAKVGRGVAVFGHAVPVCTDLLTIGDNAVIRKDTAFSCYRATDGWIETGRVTLGNDVFIGEATVIDIETSLGDGAQLGHTSSLHAGQAVPAGERWHGSPAVPTDVQYQDVAPARCGTFRRMSYAVMQLATMTFLYMPLVLAGTDMLLAEQPHLADVVSADQLALTGWAFYHDALVLSALVFFGAIAIGLVFVAIVPRLLFLAIRPGRTYRLYGFQYSVHRAIVRLTNVKFFTYLFGDSSYIVHYLRWLGYDLSRVEQTGSNFGTQVAHETPYLSTVGSGSMIADGLSLMNADFSSTSFRVSRVTIGPHNFLGNRVHYPTQGRTGANVLLATKAMVPIDGPIRENVGLLGSPSFEIPRSVLRDTRLAPKSPEELRRKLRAKNWYNVRTIGLALFVRWVHVFAVTLLAIAAAHFFGRFGSAAVATEIVLGTLFTVVYFVLVERAVARFRSLTPQHCSIYDRYFWWHERYWKLVIPEFDKAYVGTPFKNLVSRALGTRLGRRVFDDGCFLAERTLVTIGDECTLNAGTAIQCHSQEDGGFKSDRARIGAHCTLGVGAFVHYGVVVGDGAHVGPDSFLMKGEEVPDGARWGGNPARELRPEEWASALPAPPAGPPGAVLNGTTLNGTTLNGTALNGTALNGTVLNGTAVPVLNGTPVPVPAKAHGRHRAPSGRHSAPSR
jgi:non-ribosomal peptide synthetase-like protein